MPGGRKDCLNRMTEGQWVRIPGTLREQWEPAAPPPPPLKPPKDNNWWGGRYETVRVKDHPLATGKYGSVLAVHQLVLYEKIGPGPHPCYWCGVLVEWRQGLKGLTVDHLDWDVENNDPENLVPACWPCNKGRKKIR